MTAALSTLVGRLANLHVVDAAEPAGGILRASPRLVSRWDARRTEG
jgi:hypothetical protein